MPGLLNGDLLAKDFILHVIICHGNQTQWVWKTSGFSREAPLTFRSRGNAELPQRNCKKDVTGVWGEASRKISIQVLKEL